MKKLFRQLFTICFILSPLILSAQNSLQISQTEAINNIFEELPFEERLGETTEKLDALFSQNPFGLPAGQNQVMMEVYNTAFANDSLLKYARQEFSELYNAEAARATLEWFLNENTRKVLKAEKEFYTIQGIRKRVVNKYELEKNAPPQNRVDLIQSLANQTSATKHEVESRAIIFRAMVQAFSDLSRQQTLSEQQVEGVVVNYRNQVQSQIDQEITNQLLTLYHGLESDTIQSQIDFYSSSPGKWLNETASKSMHHAFETAAANFLKSIKKL